MKFRLTGSITNHDAARHTPIVEVRGWNRARGDARRLPTCITFARSEVEYGGAKQSVDETFEMDEVESVRIPDYFNCGLEFSFVVRAEE